MSTLINIRYRTPITNINLLRCPCCANYYNKPDSNNGLLALLQHCKRSHRDRLKEIRKSIYINNPEDEKMLKTKPQENYKQTLGKRKFSGACIEERLCQFGIKYDWDNECGGGIVMCQCRVLCPNQEIVESLARKNHSKSSDNTWKRLVKCQNHNKRLGTLVQQKISAVTWGVHKKTWACRKAQRVLIRDSLQVGPNGEKTGRGLFANWTYKMNELMTQYTGKLIDNLKDQNENYRPEYMLKYQQKVNNKIGIQGHDTPITGLGAFVQRINNGQTPNAKFWYDRKEGTIWIKALKTILPGDEILIAYGSSYKMEKFTGSKRSPINKRYFRDDNRRNSEYVKMLRNRNKR